MLMPASAMPFSAQLLTFRCAADFQLLLMLVLMLLAQGWTVRDPLISGNRRLLAIWGVYGVISVLLYVWNLVSYRSPGLESGQLPLPGLGTWSDTAPRAWNLVSHRSLGLEPGQLSLSGPGTWSVTAPQAWNLVSHLSPGLERDH